MRDLPGYVMKKDGVVVRFLLGAQDTLDTVENVDAHIYLADGSHRHATFFTTKAIDELLARTSGRVRLVGARTFGARTR